MQADRVQWDPDEAGIEAANLSWLMHRIGVDSYAELHRWSVANRAGFWDLVIERLGIVFDRAPIEILSGDDPAHPVWLAGSRLNIAISCFAAASPDAPAVLAGRNGAIETVTYGRLEAMVRAVAGGLLALGIEPGDRVAIAMPMTIEAVTAYLATIWIGATVVSIADSFAPDEITTRLELTGCDLVVTCDLVDRAGRRLPMYEKVIAGGASRAIVVGNRVELRASDVPWERLMSGVGADPLVSAPDTATNVLFSSGTTGAPKAIPWDQLTPLKVAMDAHFHHDVHPGEVLAWPTNLGWMMGPWLIYASLINGATMALYDDVPTGEGFGDFVSQAQVTMLGLVPSLVAAWRHTRCMEGLDWSSIRLFSSTGEASNPADMAYLMSLAGNKPVIEYCGGTEIGGGYISGTVLDPAVPSTFTTPALGLDFVILDEDGRSATSGEVFLVPPSIGLSTRLLHQDHDEVYYAGCPEVEGVVLRRHGDYLQQLDGHRYRVLGRVDDTMNLGGIKVSAGEIERTISATDGLAEAAAVAVAPAGGGPSRLVVFAVPVAGFEPDPEAWKKAMQREIHLHLNPLFRIHELVVVGALARTASGKVMRRRLRSGYAEPA